ncbi:transcriptional regulator ATRX [Trichonephila clavipes]|nr:transcriptional regulator ATRX [Trichonephila clavipes]
MCFCLRKPDEDVDTTLLFSHSVARGSQSTPGKGRKNIKKILAKEDLTIETKEAQNLEKERRKRVQERQKNYNIITDTSADGNEVITRKMVLEINPDSKEEIVEIHPDIVEKLKPHQVNGVKFMWECTIESVKRLEKEPGSGCILAHCMGLGKTLQVIAFLHTCLTNKLVKKHIKTAMVICPYNTVLNWSREFEHWLKLVEGDDILVHQLTVAKDNYTRLDILNYWKQDGGVLIISYDVFRRLASSKKITKLSTKSRNKILEHLIDPVYFQVDDHVDPGKCPAAVSSEKKQDLLHMEFYHHLPSWAMNKQMSYFSSFSDEWSRDLKTTKKIPVVCKYRNSVHVELSTDLTCIAALHGQLSIEKLFLEIELSRNANQSATQNNGQTSRVKSLDEIVKMVRLLTVKVPNKSDGWDYFFSSLEKAFASEMVSDELKPKVLLCMLGDKVSNLLVNLGEEELKDYESLKQVVLKEYEPSPQKYV